MVEYLQRCGFDPPTWPLLFAVIMDIRPGHVDHRGCVPHTQALRSLDISGGLGDGHFDRVYLLSWPATMELDQIPVEILSQIGRAAAALALLTVPGSFFHAESITKI